MRRAKRCESLDEAELPQASEESWVDCCVLWAMSTPSCGVLNPILAIINVSRFILPSDTVSLILELIAVIKIQAMAGFALIIGQLLVP
jgi:hypothetical protein